MTHNGFKHREVEAGYKTPCHEALTREGIPVRRNEEGYVLIHRHVSGKRVSKFVHRARFEAVNGPISNQLDHLCRNRWCCNPAHLEDVDIKTNVRRGDCTTLDEGEVALMRVLRAEGAKVVDVAREFGVSPSHASRVINGLYWSNGACVHWQQRKGGTAHL